MLAVVAVAAVVVVVVVVVVGVAAAWEMLEVWVSVLGPRSQCQQEVAVWAHHWMMASLPIGSSAGHHNRDILALVEVDVVVDVGEAREAFSTEGAQSWEGMVSEDLVPCSPGDRSQQLLKTLAYAHKDINQGN